MQEDLNLDFWKTDEKTGYLYHPTNLKAITPENKLMFLDAFKKFGNQAKAAESVGFTHRILSTHLRADKQFSKDYQQTLLEMKSVIEGVMFLRAQKDNGFMDRMAWLRKHFPKEYDPKTIASQSDKPNKDKIDELWKEANQRKK